MDRQHFTSFFSMLGNGDYQFRLISDNPLVPLEIKHPLLSLDDILDNPDIYHRLVERNNQGYGIFFVVNEGGGTDNDITRIRAHFIDSDGGLDLGAFKERTKALPPHIIVETSINRFHAYWLVNDGKLSEFKAIQTQLASFFGTDTKCVNLSRLLRVPGFNNMKPEHQIIRPVAIHSTNLKSPYSQKEILEHYRSINLDSDVTAPIPSNLKIMRTKGFGKGERNNGMFSYAVYLFAKKLSYDEVSSLVHKANKTRCTPPLSDNEVETAIKSARGTIIANDAMKVFEDIKLEDLISIVDEPLHIPEDTVRDIAYATAEQQELPDISLPPRGLVTDVYQYLMETSFETTHELAMAGALAFVGALKGHTTRSYTNARTNLFILGLAPSGTGKTEIKNRLFALSHAAEMKNFNIANPASEAGMLDALSINKRRFVAWDEFGLRLAQITKNKANSFEQGIVTFLLEVFSAGGSVFYDRTRRIDSHRKKGAAAATEIEIPYPHLSVMGISTPETFFRAVTLDQVDDGFIPRFIPVFSPPTVPKKLYVQKSHQTNMNKYSELIHQCASINMNAQFCVDDDGITGANPEEKFFTDDAFQMWAEFQYNCRTRRSDRFTPIWLRAAEHAMKVALTISDTPEITVPQARWAIDFISNTISHFLGKSYSNVAENEHSALYLRILAHIGEKADGISHRDITSRFHKHSGWKDCLSNAISTGAVEETAVLSKAGNVKGKKYRLSEQGVKLAAKYLADLNTRVTIQEHETKESEKETVCLDLDPNIPF